MPVLYRFGREKAELTQYEKSWQIPQQNDEAKVVQAVYVHILPLLLQVYSPLSPPCSVPRRLTCMDCIPQLPWEAPEGGKKGSESGFLLPQLLPYWAIVVYAPLPEATALLKGPLHTALSEVQ